MTSRFVDSLIHWGSFYFADVRGFAMRFFRVLVLCFVPAVVFADAPGASYIFPAGGQRGTAVNVRIGALNFHEDGRFLMKGEGVKANPKAVKRNTLWFEGPMIRQPLSQRKEDYPKDYANTITIAKNAKLGTRVWHLANSQGVTAGKKFVIGSLPEIVEQEIDGDPIPTPVTMPLTINGRIFPREDVDIWTVNLNLGEQVTADVNAARLGSPLDSRLEVRDPSGLVIAENGDANGLDSRVRFTASQTGTYEIRIHDVNFLGLQDYVYRLTLTRGAWLDAVYPLGGKRGTTANLLYQGLHLPSESQSVPIPKEDGDVVIHQAMIDGQLTNGVLFDLDDLPEYMERAKSDNPQAVEIPAVLNGRIEQPGETDAWMFSAKKGEAWIFDVKASSLGSPLDSVLTLFNADGKQIATADDRGNGQTDSLLKAKIPVDGTYTLKIRERFDTRVNERFAYRIRCTNAAEEPGFQITLPADAFTLTRGTDLKIKLAITRHGGLTEPIELSFDGLPQGVTVTGTTVPKNKSTAQIVLKAEEKTPVSINKFAITGEAKHGETSIKRRGSYPGSIGETDTEEFLLAIAIPTPFHFQAEFVTKYASRGSEYSRKYQLERVGFTGPIEIRMADVQARHLQGVTAAPITLDSNATEFEYTITLPCRMEVGRTSRTCIVAVGLVKDFDGTQHKVCFSSTAQNEQIIILTDPERLGLKLSQSSLRMATNSQVTVPIEVQRGVGLAGDVKIELNLPAHFREVSAETLIIPEGKSQGTLTMKFGKTPGPFNMPITVRGTILDKDNRPITAETALEIVAE